MYNQPYKNKNLLNIQLKTNFYSKIVAKSTLLLTLSVNE